jgi:hypothetical protein
VASCNRTIPSGLFDSTSKLEDFEYSIDRFVENNRGEIDQECILRISISA